MSSLNYARELLKISLSEICSSIGFDRISEVGIDILVDVCERQFQYLIKQINHSLPIDQINSMEILFFLLENSHENLYQFGDFMKQFRSIQFSNEIIQFPFRKKNQFYLRIPPKDSPQILQRNDHPTTEYIFDWLPLFPHQETPEESLLNHSDRNVEKNSSNDQEKKFDKDESHHPLTLLSFMSQNGDEMNARPVGKRPNRALPSILYRPRRILDLQHGNINTDKSRKDLEKENVEKDHQQIIQPPLRLTIPKPQPTTTTTTPPPLPNNDKPTLIKKLPTFNDSTTTTIKKSTNTISPSLNLTKKKTISPINSQNNNNNNPLDLSTHSEKKDQNVLDLSKPTNKVPTLKLSLKPVQNPQETPVEPKKSLKTTPTNKSSTKDSSQKVNLKIRTSSLPSFGNISHSNETFPMISPPLTLSNENLNKSNHFPIDQLKSINQIPSERNSIVTEEKKKKKKKKNPPEKAQSIIEKEVKSTIEPMEIEQSQPNIITTNPTEGGGGGTIRLKIKLGKGPTSSTDPPPPPPVINEPPPNPPLKSNSIRLKLPINPSLNRKKLSKPSHKSEIIRMEEDNTNSIDDLPLGERTSPSKTLFNPIFSTPMKKKSNSTNKKKSLIKKQNNILGVAVIEERRIHHDSQEKIWICPSCNRPDNGQEAMIACDLCDDWYHWECVGIVEEPPETIPWFCPKCHRSNSSTASTQGIKPSASSKAKRKRASDLFQQQQKQQQQQTPSV